MTFKSKVQTDSFHVFLNTNEFAETIQYTPYGQSAKSIKALITRGRVDAEGQAQNRYPHNRCEIHISIDDTYGVASVDKGRDKASFPERLGGTSVDWAIIDIVGKDDGMWHLVCQR